MSARLSLKLKLFYGFGSIAFGVKDLGFRAFLLLYYNQVIGLRADLVSLAIAMALVVDSLLDPVIGQVSDTMRTRWGRRHPFMYASALPAALSFYFLWLPPEGWSEMALLAYLAVLSVVVRSFIALYEIPSSALAAELTHDYDERTSVLSYRTMFSYWGAFLLYAVALLVFFVPTAEYPKGQLNPGGYEKFALVGAIMMLASILVSAWGTHDRIPTLHMPPPDARRKGPLTTLAEMLATFSNFSFLVVMGAGIASGIALGIGSALHIYWSIYVWDLSASQMAILLVDNLVAAALAVYVAPTLSRRFGKKRAKIGLVLSAILISVLPLVLRHQGLFFENDSPWLIPALLVHGVIWTTLGSASLVLTASMIADTVEDSQRTTGRRSEGLLFAASLLVQKAVSGVGVLATGAILSGVGFPERGTPGAVDPQMLNDLIAVYVFTLVGLYLVSAGILSFYRITRERHGANLAAVGTLPIDENTEAATTAARIAN